MASINEKLNYINETKSLIKDKLNDLGSEITSQTTFREYTEKIEDLYEEWPKVSNINTNILLNNTKKGKMHIELKGNLNQNGTPTQENPIDVQTVDGNNTIEIHGKNILNFETTKYTHNLTSIISGTNLKITGTAKLNYQYITNFIPNSYEAGTYTFSITEPLTRNLIFRFFDNEGATLNSYIITPGNKSISFTLTGDEAKYRLMFGPFVGETYNIDINLQLEKKNQATSYEPYQNQTYSISLGTLELCKIDSYQDYIYKNNNKWYKYNIINKIILNGNENWGTSPSSTGNGDRFVSSVIASIIKPTSSDSENAKIFSNKFIGISINNTIQATPINGIAVASSGNIVIYCDALKNYTYQEFKTWLSNNNIILYYILETPIITEITDTTLINQLETIQNANSYDNQTYLLQTNNNLPFIISASALEKNSD